MSNESFDKSAVEKSLRAVVDPATNKDVVTLGMVKHIAVFEGAIRIVLELSPQAASVQEQLRVTVDRAVRQAAVVACANIETLEIDFVAPKVAAPSAAPPFACPPACSSRPRKATRAPDA